MHLAFARLAVAAAKPTKPTEAAAARCLDHEHVARLHRRRADVRQGLAAAVAPLDATEELATGGDRGEEQQQRESVVPRRDAVIDVADLRRQRLRIAKQIEKGRAASRQLSQNIRNRKRAERLQENRNGGVVKGHGMLIS